jgi:hypothetical protein
MARRALWGIALLALSCEGAEKPPPDGGTVTLKGRKVAVALKLTEKERRAATLLFPPLSEGRGYLMAWPRERFVKLESRDARAPFDVAFLDRAGNVVDVGALNPGDEEGLMSAAEAAYALFLAPGTLKAAGAGRGDAAQFSPEIRAAAPQELPTIRVGTATAFAELALTEPERQHGLMFRPRLSADDGMLFAYPDEYPRSFWMKNTLIPLDIAFFSADGTLLNVNETPTAPNPRAGPWPPSPSAGPARFVLEMNLGWFRRHGLVDESGKPSNPIRVEMPPEALRESK